MELSCAYCLKRRVESADAFLAGDLGKAGDRASSEARLRYQSDTGGLERVEGNIGEELGEGGRNTIDCDVVVPGVLVADNINRFLLEELVTPKLQTPLQKVTRKGRAGTGQNCGSTFLLNDLTEATDQAAVVGS